MSNNIKFNFYMLLRASLLTISLPAVTYVVLVTYKMMLFIIMLPVLKKIIAVLFINPVITSILFVLYIFYECWCTCICVEI